MDQLYAELSNLSTQYSSVCSEIYDIEEQKAQCVRTLREIAELGKRGDTDPKTLAKLAEETLDLI